MCKVNETELRKLLFLSKRVAFFIFKNIYTSVLNLASSEFGLRGNENLINLLTNFFSISYFIILLSSQHKASFSNYLGKILFSFYSILA